MIIGITGMAIDGNKRATIGVGKDEVANLICKRFMAVKIAMADPMKRICRDVYDFDEEQLWGPSENRDAPDRRYKRPSHDFNSKDVCDCCGVNRFQGEECYLTPRYALRLLGSEWARRCHPDTWVIKMIRTAYDVLKAGVFYNQEKGAFGRWSDGFSPEYVPVPDVRFVNEVEAIRNAGGRVIRVIREVPIKAESSHSSETGLLNTGDNTFDYVIDNSGDLHHLGLQVDRMMSFISGRIRRFEPDQADVPPFKRK
jgi:hypothetical protein